MDISLKLCILLVVVCRANAWTYEEQGEWVAEYPLCGGMRQSPIEFTLMEVQTRTNPPLQFQNYENLNTATITNNGHTAEIQLPNTADKPQISGGPLEAGSLYEFVNVHFHWGSNDSLGSEHLINRQRYAMEVHAVHYNTKYPDLQEALNHADGVAVLTTLYQSNPTQGLAGLQSVSNSLSSIEQYDTSTEIGNFRLSSLFNRVNTPDKRTYYTYQGSLTTPPCSEAVTWIIFTNPISITPAQLKPFRQLREEDGSPLVNNFRYLQKKNGRKVYLNRPKSRVPILGGK